MNAALPSSLAQPGPSAVTLRHAVATGQRSAADVTASHVARIERVEPTVHAWAAFDATLPTQRAAALDRELASGALAGLLAGVPIGLKDLFDTLDWPTTYGSSIYRDHRPTRNAAAVQQVIAAGAVAFGKTVTTEFGYFQPGPTANPHRLTHTPGGSSSGSAAAVAAGMVPLAFGTQTAGSLIRPASYCGVWALKPTHGRFSLDGVQGLSHSLDTLGWMANDAHDLELLRCALAGDTFQPLDVPRTVRLASWRTFEASLLDSSGEAVWEAAHQRLTAAGQAPVPFAMPEVFARLFDAQKTVMAYEACRTLAATLRDHRGQLSAPLVQLLDSGTHIQEADYQAALALAGDARDWCAQVLQGVDALLVPAAPGEAPEGLNATGDPAFSRVWTLLGLPCVNVPALRGPGGLPVGLQLVGRAGGERALLGAAQRLQQALLQQP